MTHTDGLLEPHEAELRGLLQRTMSGTTAPAEIGPHALRRGRRLRTRRRAGIAAGAVAASAIAALVLPTALGRGSTTVVDPAGDPSSAATAPAQESPTPGVLPDGWWNMPSTDMVSTVEAILPDGITVTDPGPLMADTPEGGPGAGYIVPVVTGPTGAGRLNVMLYPTAPEDEATSPGGTPTEAASGQDGGYNELRGDEALDYVRARYGDISCPGNLSPRAECTELHADGTLIGRRSSTTFGEVTTLEVVLQRDGGTVYAAAANTVDDKWGRGSPASAELPPLTLDQLEDLVRNDTWVRPAS